MHQFECIHPYNACKQFDSGLLQKVGVLIVPTLGRPDEQLVIFYDYVERFLSTLTDPVSVEWDSWRMRLPKFYINFDKKIYRHTDWYRSHEASVPSNWNAQANSDFGLLVPDKEQYWLINGMNFWKLQM